MKFFLTNIRAMLRGAKSVVVINVVGLSVAFAVTVVVAAQVWYDLTYDRGYENSGRIFFSELDWNAGGGPMPYTNQQIPEIWAARIPQIEGYALVGTQVATTYFRRAVDGVDGPAAGDIPFLVASPGFMDVFTPEIVAGDASEALIVPGHCIISETNARAIFGDDDPIGQEIVSGRGDRLVVDAVYRDFPKNSSVASGVYTYQQEEEFGRFNSHACLMLSPADLDRVRERMGDTSILAEFGEMMASDYKFYLTELSDYHLRGGATGTGGVVRSTVYLLVIGLFVLVVALINFINLSMAMAPSRVRAINIHKILGIGKRGMRLSMAMESVLVSAVAFGIGVLIVRLFSSSIYADYFTADLSPEHNVALLAVTLAALLAVAFAVGLHSSLYATSFDEAIALKSSFVLSRKGARLRNVLIVVQFATAIFFICFASAIKMQYDYMAGYDMGYEKENIVVFDAGQTRVEADALAEEFRRNPDIVDVTSSFDMPGSIGSFSGSYVLGKQVSYHTWVVAGNFLDFFGIDATPGRLDAGFMLYTQEGVLASTMIVNREFMRRFDFTETQMDEAGVGVVDDVNFQSLHEPVKPMAFTMIPEWKENLPKVFVKIAGGNVPATMEYIEKTWKAVSGSSGGVNLTFLDDELDRLYRRESNMSRLMGILGLVAVVIAIMGVYGLAMFNTRYKTREIAVRKINGATISGVMMMLNRGMLASVAMAFVAVVPLTVWLVERWMGAFAFRMAVPWWLYPAAGAVVLAVSVATVSWQSWRAASTNPVKALKTE